MIASFKLKLKAITKRKETVKVFVIQKLQDRKMRQAYCVPLSNKFVNLTCDETGVLVEEKWNITVECVRRVAK